MQQDQKQRKEWWKPRDIFCKFFVAFFVFGLFILVFPHCPFYCFAREKTLDSRNMQLMALFATLFGFSVAIEYLNRIFRRQEDKIKENEKRDREKKPLQEKEIELKKILTGKESEYLEKLGRGEDVSLIIKDIDDIKREIINIQEEIQYL